MKIIRVDMPKKSICVEDVPKNYFGLGGRALTAAIINKEVPPMCDALGPENKLIFAPWLLSGTNFVNTSRISVGTKSPLTGTIKESNGGGTIAAALGHLGITAVVVEGKPAPGEMFILGIDEKGEANLIKADEYKGMRTYKLMEKLIDSFGSKISVMCVGPAGEYLMKSASIQTSDVDNRPCRVVAWARSWEPKV